MQEMLLYYSWTNYVSNSQIAKSRQNVTNMDAKISVS